MANGDLCLVYITTGSLEEARRVGRTLVEQRLAACVNILEGMRSLYWWKEKVQEDNEVVVLAKTQAALVPRLTAEVKTVHSYECPCVVSLPVTGGNSEFLEWIERETR